MSLHGSNSKLLSCKFHTHRAGSTLREQVTTGEPPRVSESARDGGQRVLVQMLNDFGCRSPYVCCVVVDVDKYTEQIILCTERNCTRELVALLRSVDVKQG